MKITKTRCLILILFLFVTAVTGWGTWVIAEDASQQKEYETKSSASLNHDSKPEDSAVDEKMTPCPEPRPQICTMDYRPVCATLQDGSVKTYSNGCSACTDPAVTGYQEGAFE